MEYITTIVAVAFLAIGIIFIFAAILANLAYKITEDNSVVLTGVLLGFRKEVITYDISKPRPGDASRYDEDYLDNSPNLLPLLKFTKNGEEIVRTAQVPSPGLSRDDIGKPISLRCTKSSRVIINDDISIAANKRLQSRVTCVLIIVAVFFLALATVSCSLMDIIIKNLGGQV